MNLQDLIEKHFRPQVADVDAPYLWSDDEVLQYAIDAQDMFVRLVGGLADMTVVASDPGVAAGTALADLDVTASTPFTAHSPYILRIKSARLVTAKIDVPIINEPDLAIVPTKDYGWTRGLSLDDTDIGDVRFAVLGLRENQIRWMRVPNATDTCRLHVLRLPLPRIAAQEDALEIGTEHHFHLVKWMKYLAYSKQDSEVLDPKKAIDNEQAFRAYCEQARKEIEKRRYKPRVVQFDCPGYT